jgi:hypothetical protein
MLCNITITIYIFIINNAIEKYLCGEQGERRGEYFICMYAITITSPAHIEQKKEAKGEENPFQN